MEALRVLLSQKRLKSFRDGGRYIHGVQGGESAEEGDRLSCVLWGTQIFLNKWQHISLDRLHLTRS